MAAALALPCLAFAPCPLAAHCPLIGTRPASASCKLTTVGCLKTIMPCLSVGFAFLCSPARLLAAQLHIDRLPRLHGNHLLRRPLIVIERSAPEISFYRPAGSLLHSILINQDEPLCPIPHSERPCPNAHLSFPNSASRTNLILKTDTFHPHVPLMGNCGTSCQYTC